MRTLLTAIIVLGMVVIGGGVGAQTSIHPDANLDALDSEVITVTTSGVGVTASKMMSGGRQIAKGTFVVESNAVRCRWDGTAPTAGAAGTGTGLRIDAGQSFVLYGREKLSKLSCKELTGAATAYIDAVYEYYK